MNFLLVVINFVLLVAAVVILAMASMRKYDTWDLEIESESMVDNVIFAVGVFVAVTATFGIAVSTCTHRILFLIYGVALILCQITLMGTGIVAVLQTITQRNFIRGPLAEKFRLYTNATSNETKPHVVDLLQTEWKCCGFRNVSHPDTKLPISCCHLKKYCTFEHSSRKNCRDSAHTKLVYSMKVTALVLIALSVLDVCGVSARHNLHPSFRIRLLSYIKSSRIKISKLSNISSLLRYY